MASLTHVSTVALLQWMLERPDLVLIVQNLDARPLERLVEYVGVEDMGEILALATTEQFERVFDEELWRYDDEEGRNATARFELWLEILLEAGNEVAVEKVAAMDEVSLAQGLSKHVFVLDLDTIAAALATVPSEQHELIEQALASSLYEKVEEHRIIARDAIRWKGVTALFHALAHNHREFLGRVLEQCCARTRSHIQASGSLYEVLGSAPTREANVASQLDARRERQGTVTAATAASFLRLTRTRTLPELLFSQGYDPITRAHFKSVPSRVQTPWAPAPPRVTRAERKLDAFVRDLGATNVRPAPLVQRAMRELHAEAADVFGERFHELNYLMDVVLAVSQEAEQPPRPIEAIGVVMSVCDLGITRLIEERGLNKAAEDPMLAYLVKKHGVTKAFRIGWNLVGDERWTGEGLRDLSTRASQLALRA